MDDLTRMIEKMGPSKLPHKDIQKYLNESIKSTDASRVSDEQVAAKLQNKHYDIYATRIGWIAISYIFAVFFIILLDGFGLHFHLSDTVLVTLLGTTMANILGLMYIVANHLFQKNPKDSE